MRQVIGVFRVDTPACVIQIQFVARVQQIHVGFPKGVNCPDILPVALELIGMQDLVFPQHLRDQILSEIVAGFCVFGIRLQHFAQQFPVEDIDAHRRERRLRIFRLFFKFEDAARRVGVHNTEAGSFFLRDINDRDGNVRIRCPVFGQHGGIVHLVDMVAGEYQDKFGIVLIHKIDVLGNRVRRTAVDVQIGAGLFPGRQDIDTGVVGVESPAARDGDVAVQKDGFVLRQNADHVDVGIGAVAKRKVNNTVFPAIGNSRFGQLVGQIVKSGAASARQNHGNHGMLLHVGTPYRKL